MSDTIGKLLSRSRGTTYFLYILGTVLSAILCWAFVLSIQAGMSTTDAVRAIPSQLEIAWGTIIGLIVGGHEEEINKAERLLNKDLDGDGDIGVAGGSTSQIVASAPIVKEVADTNAECDPTKYTV